MARHLEDGPQWDLYQFAIKELVTNKHIDVKDHPGFDDTRTVNGESKKISALAPILGHLASPNSHKARVRLGITDENTNKGVILREGMGKYVYFPTVHVGGRRNDTITVDDELHGLAKHNPRWSFRRKAQPKPEPEPEPTAEPQGQEVIIPGGTLKFPKGRSAADLPQPPQPVYDVIGTDAKGRFIIKNLTTGELIVAVAE